MEIRKAAVIGAGVMGGGIAAHLANAGIEVLLLDQAREEGPDRAALARGAIARMLKADPAPFMAGSAARLVTPGTVEDDLPTLAQADWIVEAVVENADVKRTLYRRLEEVTGPDTAISSNTSTIPLSVLMADQSPALRRRFLITHFFNPPRYMRLLELVAGPDTDPHLVEAVRRCADFRLGKGVIDARDCPGFIANRIGTYWIQAGLNGAFDLGLTVEEADAAMGRPAGVPKTGIFALMDLVGIDLLPHLLESLLKTLPETDPFRDIVRDEPMIGQMIEQGRIGRKGGGGFYRLDRSGGQRRKQRIDLVSGVYVEAERPRPEAVEAAREGGLRALVNHPSPVGRYAWQVLSGTLSYAAHLVPTICDTVSGVDEAMRLGYNWRHGPFELIDKLGADWFAGRLEAEGRVVPGLLAAARSHGFYGRDEGRRTVLQPDGTRAELRRPEGVLLLADVKSRSEPLLKNGSAALWDLGDGVTCFEFTTKMNALDEQTMALLGRAIAVTGEDHRAMVIYNEGANFSAGANLAVALFGLNLALWGEVERLVKQGQETYLNLKYAPFPVVGAPSGLALGGACEILLHCDAVVAHAESYIGLVEVGVGLIPGWGGCKEMLFRNFGNKKLPRGPMPPLQKTFELIGTAQTATSAARARELLYLREDDRIVMNRDRLLAEAKAAALALAVDYAPPPPPEPVALPGPAAKAAMDLAVAALTRQGKATAYDVTVAGALADVLSGGDTDITRTRSEADLLALEVENFMTLVRREPTLERLEHMLETGKPLRN